MKLTLSILSFSFVLGLGAQTVASFSSGSDGSDGPLDVTTNTVLPLPPDGIFNFTTVNVASGATLSFAKNAANTPVYILATGDVTIAGIISVSGTNGTATSGGVGGPGGWDGGQPGTNARLPGAGKGPGGGRPGTEDNAFLTSEGDEVGVWLNASSAASYATHPMNELGQNFRGSTYGNGILIPLLGGSGGAGTVYNSTPGLSSANGGGGGGGGAILIASNTRILLGNSSRTVIEAVGGRGTASTANTNLSMNGSQGGSGGAIRLVAPQVSGRGYLYATENPIHGGHGRIRIDTANFGPAIPSIMYGVVSIGANPVIFPNALPQLRVTEIGGHALNPADPQTLLVTLPADGNPLRSVEVTAENFTGAVNFIVEVFPEVGATTTFSGTIPDGPEAIRSTTIDVTFPLNVSSEIYVWPAQLFPVGN